MITGQILALDLAATTGWALGTLKDSAPEFGSIRWAKEGASLAATLSGCRQQLGDFLFQHPGIEMLVFESPMAPLRMKGRTNMNTTRMLIGLCSVVEELIYSRNLSYRAAGLPSIDCREASVAQVRSHFIGSNKHKREAAKNLTINQCYRLGWKTHDDNEADACALWDYQCSILRKENLFSRVARSA